MTDADETKACREALNAWRARNEPRTLRRSEGAWKPLENAYQEGWLAALDRQKAQQAVSEPEAVQILYEGYAGEHGRANRAQIQEAFRALSTHFTITKKEPSQ